jgi:hypothetical protein
VSRLPRRAPGLSAGSTRGGASWMKRVGRGRRIALLPTPVESHGAQGSSGNRAAADSRHPAARASRASGVQICSRQICLLDTAVLCLSWHKPFGRASHDQVCSRQTCLWPRTNSSGTNLNSQRLARRAKTMEGFRSEKYLACGCENPHSNRLSRSDSGSTVNADIALIKTGVLGSIHDELPHPSCSRHAVQFSPALEPEYVQGDPKPVD